MKYPLKLKPAFKDYLWGGTRLKTEFDMDCDLDIVAEAWTLSCHKDGHSMVENGAYSGQTLEQAVAAMGRESLGEKGQAFEQFPILIKLIDAKGNLSIQVHPNDEYAQRVEGEYGKTEMWYVVDCDEGAYLYYGFNKDISKEEFKTRIENDTLLEVLNKVEVKKGDVFFIESGTLHAIGAGLLIAEIQQNSNTTYRVYDYGRVGADGKPRELHVAKAVDVTNTVVPSRKPEPQGKPEQKDGYTSTLLAQCKYFTTYELNIDTKAALSADESSFQSVLVLGGTGSINCGGEAISFKKGDSFFIPAGLGAYEIEGSAKVIVSRV